MKKSKPTEPMSVGAAGAGGLTRRGGAVVDDELPESETKETISDDVEEEDCDEVKEIIDGAREHGRESKEESKTDSSEEKDSDTDIDTDIDTDTDITNKGRHRGESNRDSVAKNSEDATSCEEKTDNTTHTTPGPSPPSLVDIMKNKIHPRMKVDPSIHFSLPSSVSFTCR
jgi:hypothetical protein